MSQMSEIVVDWHMCGSWIGYKVNLNNYDDCLTVFISLLKTPYVCVRNTFDFTKESELHYSTSNLYQNPTNLKFGV